MSAQRNTTRIMWLDLHDQALFDELPDLAWCDNKTEAFAHSLRYALLICCRSNEAHHTYRRDADAGYKRSKQNLLRLSSREWKAMKEMKQRTASSTLTEACRLVVRIGHEYFSQLVSELENARRNA